MKFGQILPIFWENLEKSIKMILRQFQDKIMKRDFLSITDLSPKEILDILELAGKLKAEYKKTGANKPLLKNKQMAMIFEKASLRTKLSFDMGFDQLGGHALYFGSEEIGLGKRESVSDIAKVTSSMSDLIVARVFSHKSLVELAKDSTVPVINALSDTEHPCQALADLLTILEIKKNLKGLKIAFIGDGNNNVTHSLCLISVMLGLEFRVASPQDYFMDKKVSSQAKSFGKVIETDDPLEAVDGADIIYTDTWVSMGSEAEREERIKIFKTYQVDSAIMDKASKDAIFMHDLPAYRGSEVAPDVIDGPQSVVFHQAENRMHAQKALMVWMIGGDLYE